MSDVDGGYADIKPSHFLYEGYLKGNNNIGILIMKNIF